MQNTEIPQRPLRLVGICKRCKKLRFGFLLYGLGPFICYECAKEAAEKGTDQKTLTFPETVKLFFTSTTSNSTSANVNFTGWTRE